MAICLAVRCLRLDVCGDLSGCMVLEVGCVWLSVLYGA